MRIKNKYGSDSPEINLIPLIDILLVIVIFLVVNTTFIRKAQLQVQLPGTGAAQTAEQTKDPLVITVGRDGNYGFNNRLLVGEGALRQALTLALAGQGANPESHRQAVIEADASATHQSVVSVMDILASLGIVKVSIATASIQ